MEVHEVALIGMRNRDSWGEWAYGRQIDILKRPAYTQGSRLVS